MRGCKISIFKSQIRAFHLDKLLSPIPEAEISAGQLQASSKVRQAGFIGDLNGITTNSIDMDP